MKPHYQFRAYGLTIDSELDFPEVEGLSGTPEADVLIRFGHVPENLTDAVVKRLRFQVSHRQFLLTIDSIARYLVTEGRTILIDPSNKADHSDLRAFLLNPVLGALLLQRGLFLLNGASVAINNEGIIFAGQSCTGKSTLAAACLYHEFSVLSDDICAITISEAGLPQILPGFPILKLWSDSLKLLNIDIGQLTKQRRLLEKYILPLTERFYSEPVPFNRLYVFEMTNRSNVESLRINDTVSKLAELSVLQFQAGYLADPSFKASCFRQCVNLAQKLDINQVRWASGFFCKDNLTSFIKESLIK
ncbi:MAG: hypothetical protein WC799_11640 [Desulfobacteraceae bacterium]|jgi:hypothetical protein